MQINSINNYQFNIARNLYTNSFGRTEEEQADGDENAMAVMNRKREIKKLLSGVSGQQKNMPSNSVLDNSSNYLNSLREARNKTKNTALEKKKLRYSYKSVSSKIINCKKSYLAKEVVGQAKREVARLKKLKSKGEYDPEELEAALAHAQAMERVAKKKARHLIEEEMARAAGGACIAEIEEKEDSGELSEEISEEEYEEEMTEELMEPTEEYIEYDLPDPEQYFYEQQTYQMMSDMLSQMTEEMTDLMEEMGLDELFDGMGITVEKDMDPADLKMLKIKHRTREMKDIAEADVEYLKVIFEQLERSRAAATVSLKTDTAAPAMDVSGGGPALAAIANVPVADAPSVSIDISI
ncbi:MAG: hypothetical protein K6G69_00645 [Lachnospiraceae bacterium]|nr:hypothetical protein [Lachnospiraceae bacterium]